MKINKFNKKSNFLLMAGKGEGRAHPARVDRYSLVRGETDHYEGVGLKTATDASGEYHLYVPGR